MSVGQVLFMLKLYDTCWDVSSSYAPERGGAWREPGLVLLLSPSWLCACLGTSFPVASKPPIGPGGQQGRESQAGVTAMLLELGACCAPPGCLSQVFPGISILPFPAPCRIHGLQTAVEGQTTAGAKGTAPCPSGNLVPSPGDPSRDTSYKWSPTYRWFCLNPR